MYPVFVMWNVSTIKKHTFNKTGYADENILVGRVWRCGEGRKGVGRGGESYGEWRRGEV